MGDDFVHVLCVPIGSTQAKCCKLNEAHKRHAGPQAYDVLFCVGSYQSFLLQVCPSQRPSEEK